jgi:hypothetical protein
MVILLHFLGQCCRRAGGDVSPEPLISRCSAGADDLSPEVGTGFLRQKCVQVFVYKKYWVSTAGNKSYR